MKSPTPKRGKHVTVGAISLGPNTESKRRRRNTMLRSTRNKSET